MSSPKFPICDSLAHCIVDQVHSLTKEELTYLASEIRGVTTTNCWYATYDIAKMLKNQVPQILKIKYGGEDITAPTPPKQTLPGVSDGEQ